MNRKTKILVLLLLSATLGFFYAFADIVRGRSNVIVSRINYANVVSCILSGNMMDESSVQYDMNLDGNVSVVDLVHIIDLENCNHFANHDTLFIKYDPLDGMDISNPDTSAFRLSVHDNDIEVYISGTSIQRVISLSGKCDDGRLRVISDTTYTLQLAGVELSSSHAPAINSSTKQKMTLSLRQGTENVMTDAKKYVFADSLEQANACICSQGNITIEGTGSLCVKAKSKHGIASGKGMRLKEGTIQIVSAPSDAIHSGKYIHVEGSKLLLDGQKQDGLDADEEVILTDGDVNIKVIGEGEKAVKCGSSFEMRGGLLNLDVAGASAKGIKAKGDILIEAGTIEAVANGLIVIDKGDPSYCTIIKGDANVNVTGGELKLVSHSDGGKCISADRNLYISGGEQWLETHGDGTEYINALDEVDYYTSKCISADDSLFVHRGAIHCLSTGIGGKGIVAGKYLEIGLPTDTAWQQGPAIQVETTNESIVNNVEEDQRYGCPKAIKASGYLNIYSGDIHATTAGMGGEGIECNKEFYFYGGNLECICFDDGINVGEKIEVLGGQIYCSSVDNDGIDSNGSIYLKGGIVAAVNQSYPNESIDAEALQLYLQGGTFFGIGSGSVRLERQENCFYSTIYNADPQYPVCRGLRLTQGKYLHLVKGDRVIMSLLNDNPEYRQFVTVTSPEFYENEEFRLLEGSAPLSPTSSLAGNKLYFAGRLPLDVSVVTDIRMQHEQEY